MMQKAKLHGPVLFILILFLAGYAGAEAFEIL